MIIKHVPSLPSGEMGEEEEQEKAATEDRMQRRRVSDRAWYRMNMAGILVSMSPKVLYGEYLFLLQFNLPSIKSLPGNFLLSRTSVFVGTD